MARESYATQQAKIKKQIDQLKKKAESLQNRRRKPVIAAIIRDMREYAITPEEILSAFGKSPSARRVVSPRKNSGGAKKVVPAKYKHPETGATWTGRGKPPRWLSDAEKLGTSRDTFLISTPIPASQQSV